MNEPNKERIADRLLKPEDLKEVSGAGMHSEIIEGVCPVCGKTLLVHLYETNMVQRINAECTTEGCTYSYDYYFFKE